MPMTDRISRAPAGARNIEAGALLIGAGAALLLISLFLEWYQPGIDAWTVFEVWDLVLAALAVGALAAVASRMGYGAPRPASWLIGPAAATLVIVVYAFLDPPPATAGLVDGDPGTGLWLALVAAVLMATGAVLSVARISVAITAAAPAYGSGRAAYADPAVAADPRTAPAAPSRSAAPAAPAVEDVPPLRSGRFGRGGRPAAGEPGEPLPTEPTRPL